MLEQPITRFTISIADEPVARVFAVTGELDLATADRLADALLGFAETANRRAIVDLSACTFIDSSGLLAIVRGHRALSAANVSEPRMTLVSNGATSRIFELTRLGDVIPVFGTREEALARG